eukprot:1162880-Amphidinium_carterae.1
MMCAMTPEGLQRNYVIPIQRLHHGKSHLRIRLGWIPVRCRLLVLSVENKTYRCPQHSVLSHWLPELQSARCQVTQVSITGIPKLQREEQENEAMP